MKSKSNKVLLIEDNPGDARLLQEMLAEIRDVSFELEWVDRLSTGLERLAAGGIDVVLLDLSLPDSQGFETFAKTLAQASGAPIILLTGLNDEMLAIKAAQEGAQDYLIKGQVDGNLLTRAMRYAIERKRAEQALREAKDYTDNIIRSMIDSLIVFNPDMTIKNVNQATLDLLGYKEDELVGRQCGILFDQESFNIKEFEHLTGSGEVRDYTLTFRTKGGCEIPVLFNGSTIRDKEGELIGIVGIARDMREIKRLMQREKKLAATATSAAAAEKKKAAQLEAAYKELRETQARLIQVGKMSAVGQLAAGVAHEINNPIGFVSSNVRTLSDYQNDINKLIEHYKQLIANLKDTAKDLPFSIEEKIDQIAMFEKGIDIDFILDDVMSLVEECREGTERVKNIVLALKDFAHPSENEMCVANINEGIKSTLNVVWNELKYKAVVTKNYGELPLVECYPQQLNQVFMNILVNAAQAIEKQGEIRISTRDIGNCIEIKISDTGVGIPEENLSKIFDPFFTTKDVGKGTGLGMNVAYNIIQKHKGTIDVDSAVGVGTTFTIRIPVGLKIED